MATYVVMAPPDARAADPIERAVFIRDGFAWLGFFVPALWLLWHRLWIEAGVTVIALVGLTAMADMAGVAWAGPLFSLLISIFVGLEGQALRVAALARRGWRDLGVVEAMDREEAETRLIIEKDGGDADDQPWQPAYTAPAPTAAVPTRPVSPVPSFGLVPYSRKP